MIRGVISILLFFHFIVVICQTTTDKKEITHPVYGKATVESTYKDKKIIQQKTFTRDKNYTNGHAEIGEMILFYPNEKIKYKGGYYESSKTDFFGQRTVKKDGEWLSYTKEGVLEAKTNFKADKIHGVYVDYYDDRKVRSELIYVNGVLDGLAKRYFENGQLHRAIIYKEGRIENVKTFFDIEGVEIPFGTLKNGNGTLKILNLETGKLEKIVTCEEGVLKDISTEVQSTIKGEQKILTYKNSDGSIKKVKRLLNDVLEGKQEFYNYQGKLDSTVHYKNGKKHGLFITYMRDGITKANEINFVQGKKIGKYIKRRHTEDEGHPVLAQYGTYNEKEELSGVYNAYLGEEKQLIETGVYKNDKRVGIWEHYNRKGELYKKIHFKKSNQQKIKEYYPEKTILKSITSYKNNYINGEFKLFFNNSQLKKKGKYINRKKEGQWTKYNEEGKLLEDKRYSKGNLLKEKEYTYFPNGKIKKEYFKTYSDSTSTTKKYTVKGNLYKLESHKDFKTGVRSIYIKKHGPFKLYNEDGTQLLEEGNYKEGKKEGVWKIYDDKEDLMERINYSDKTKR